MSKFIVGGPYIFVLGSEGNFTVYNVDSTEVIKQKTFSQDFHLMVHPPTYVNKLLFASTSALELWNVVSDTLIFAFPLEGKAKITCVEPSPVTDIVAVGFSNGEI